MHTPRLSPKLARAVRKLTHAQLDLLAAEIVAEKARRYSNAPEQPRRDLRPTVRAQNAA